MTTEEEKRLHRCCFSGQRPEKLDASEEKIKQWLSDQIDQAIAAGYTTFISGCGMGVDIWAGRIVLEKKSGNPALHLIAATPWPGFPAKWNTEWRGQYNRLLREADITVPVSNCYHQNVFKQRNEWMVDHSSRLIAYYNGAPGSTEKTIEYAKNKRIEVITNNPDYVPKKSHMKEEEVPALSYPENIITKIGLTAVFEKKEYSELTADQLAGLEYILEALPERERMILRLHYREKETLKTIGEHLGVTRQRVQQLEARSFRKLRHPSRIAYIQRGFEKEELAKKIKCAEGMKKLLTIHRKRYPLMTEEDIVKFAFQGMLGVGHLIDSGERAKEYLHVEMEGLEPDDTEPLTERISSEWFRLNLRAALKRGLSEEEICRMLCESARIKPLSFTRQNVCNFCIKLDGSEKMRAAAEKLQNETWLPRHSDQYREAYRPAYRVLHISFIKKVCAMGI